MIRIERLVKDYSGKKVLDGINLDIDKGSVFSIMGPSGTGKSTLLKCLVGLVRFDAGLINIDGALINKDFDEISLHKIRRKIGYLFQDGALFDSLNVFENVSFGLKYLTDIPKSEYKKIVKQKLDMLGLKDVQEKPINQLSGGMRKRVALARAIAFEPEYVLYDEPTAGLDPVNSSTVANMIKETSKALNITSVIVTHDLRLAVEISDKIAFLNAGKIAEVGTPKQIQESKNELVRNFIDNWGCKEIADA